MDHTRVEEDRRSEGKMDGHRALTATCSDKFEYISESAKEHLRLLKR